MEQIIEDLWFCGDDGRFVTTAIGLILRGNDRHHAVFGAEENHLGVVFAQINLVEAGLHHAPKLHGLLARLDIEQHLSRMDAVGESHQLEATEEFLGSRIGRHPHIGTAYLRENPFDETEGV